MFLVTEKQKRRDWMAHKHTWRELNDVSVHQASGLISGHFECAKCRHVAFRQYLPLRGWKTFARLKR